MRTIKTLAAALAGLALVLGGCGSDDDPSTGASPTTTTTAPSRPDGEVPDREPDLIGTVTQVEATTGAEGRLGTILVEGDLAPERGRKISYTVTTDTVITGSADAFEDLADGQLAETWAAGPCAESYPEQCELAAIRVTG
jgi:hypothetical protein